jgi:hypothetical protein
MALAFWPLSRSKEEISPYSCDPERVFQKFGRRCDILSMSRKSAVVEHRKCFVMELCRICGSNHTGGRLEQRLPDEQKNRSREQCSHRNVEYSHNSLRVKKSLQGGSESKPDKTTR